MEGLDGNNRPHPGNSLQGHLATCKQLHGSAHSSKLPSQTLPFLPQHHRTVYPCTAAAGPPCALILDNMLMLQQSRAGSSRISTALRLSTRQSVSHQAGGSMSSQEGINQPPVAPPPAPHSSSVIHIYIHTCERTTNHTLASRPQRFKKPSAKNKQQ